ncbi:NmrA/HSCARG family protein [Anaeromyxobacter terrae]|uniref:NmrA/HSCARG family protein n=1 Tax=Anaeromyxobacter terrae TaxID=2925406 RepID=UPI001F594A11|nr:NmrA/HSCARG family protein [Anaeromyxobacter sp. SG22]
MANDRTVLVTGATGKQGGATLRHLARRGGFALRAMTRKPEGDAAKAVAALGAELVQGDLDDAASLERALTGAWGVFAVQNTWEAGVVREEEQGKRLAELARRRGVQHFVYSSVGSAHLATGIPHFDNKARVEEAVRGLGFPSHVILRPVFFMENLVSPGFLQGDALVTALRPTTKLQMIASDDIGRFAAQAFVEAEKWRGTETDLAGDAVTMPEAAEVVSELVGRKLAYRQIPMEAVRANSEDFALMLEWFERVGYSADIPSLEARWGIRPMTLREWARQQRGR